MQLADSPEMCSLNHFNSGHFMQVHRESPGFRDPVSGPTLFGRSWPLVACWDFQGAQGWKHLHELHEGGKAADRAVPGDQIINVWNDSGAPCVLPRKSTCMHNAWLGCGSDSSGTGVRTHLQWQAGRSTPGFGCWETQSHEDENRAFQEGKKS